MTDQVTHTQPSNNQNGRFTPFDPMKDVDLSGMEIIDTSRGQKINYNNIPFGRIYRLKCKSCGLVYEGSQRVDECPRCKSKDLYDYDD